MGLYFLREKFGRHFGAILRLGINFDVKIALYPNGGCPMGGSICGGGLQLPKDD